MHDVPMSSVEKDPFMLGRLRTMMAMMLPTSPNTLTVVSRTPSMTNSKVFWGSLRKMLSLKLRKSLKVAFRPDDSLPPAEKFDMVKKSVRLAWLMM